MPALPAQISVHDGTPAAHYAMGAGACARNRAAASRCEPAGDAPAARDGRTSLWDAQDADGRDTLSDEAPAEGCDRDGPARTRLQSHARDEYYRCSTTPGGDEGIVALLYAFDLETKRGDGGLVGALVRA